MIDIKEVIKRIESGDFDNYKDLYDELPLETKEKLRKNIIDEEMKEKIKIENLTERLESKLGKSKLSEDINNAENKFKSTNNPETFQGYFIYHLKILLISSSKSLISISSRLFSRLSNISFAFRNSS